jgi:hypothetical protein
VNMSCVTQHSVPCILTQNNVVIVWAFVGDLIDGTDKDRTFFNWIITGDKT